MPDSRSSNIIDNPFVKPENKTWHLTPPTSLHRPVSPPSTPRRTKRAVRADDSIPQSDKPHSTASTASVEAGKISIDDHVEFFSAKILTTRLPIVKDHPRIPHQEWLDLYQRNLTDRGHHFVVHQHDHPIAGTHYDLRLQCNATSSISFAIMYGLPGDPNSRRLNRNATETRVHNLWNHLIETASYDTGTMLVWDTGEYSVLPYNNKKKTSRWAGMETDESGSDTGLEPPTASDSYQSPESEQEKLYRAFQSRKIKLRLHGTRLPWNYTISLRLTHENNRERQPRAPAFRRRRTGDTVSSTRESARPGTHNASQSSSPQDSSQQTSTTEDIVSVPNLKRSVSSLHRTASPPRPKRAKHVGSAEDIQDSSNVAMSDLTARAPQATESDEQIRLENAYPGASNTINSIHQRKWFLSMDRIASGFSPVKSKKGGSTMWQRTQNPDGTMAGFERFHVLGREYETSVVTGRKAVEVARDEGLVDYKPRGGWRGITE